MDLNRIFSSKLHKKTEEERVWERERKRELLAYLSAFLLNAWMITGITLTSEDKQTVLDLCYKHPHTTGVHLVSDSMFCQRSGCTRLEWIRLYLSKVVREIEKNNQTYKLKELDGISVELLPWSDNVFRWTVEHRSNIRFVLERADTALLVSIMECTSDAFNTAIIDLAATRQQADWTYDG